MVGYKEAFPPLAQPTNSISSVSGNRKRPQDYDAFSEPSNRNSQYSTLDGSDDEDDEDNSNIAYQFGNGFKRLKPKRENQDSNRSTNRRVPIFPETFLTPPSNTQDSNFPFASRSSNRPRTPTLKRKQYDQSFADSDLKISRVTVFPPKTYSQTERPRKITPPIASTIDTNSVNLRLPNAQNSDHKRINYNYHPIIDFFEDEGEKEPQRNNQDLHRKAGKIIGASAEDSWRPVVGG